MKHLCRFLVLSSCLMAGSAAYAQESKEAQRKNMEAFAAALDTYSACLMTSAEKMSADSGDSPEEITDRAHAACKVEYGKAASLAFIYTASTVPDEGKLKAAEYAMHHMSLYKAEVRAGLLKSIAAWCAGKEG